ncbi:hypothetical protein ACLB2K_026727 [Fragaria x ananassa]
MRRLGVWADEFTLSLVIRACAFTGRSRLCKNVHSHVIQMGFQYHLHVVNEFIGIYALNYDCDGACEIYNRMELDGLEPNPVTWTSLLSSHARCGRNEKTMELFDMMRIRGTEATAEVLAVVLSVCADMALVDKGKKIHIVFVLMLTWPYYLWVSLFFK